MSFKVLTLFLASLVCQVLCLTRTEVRDQYQPTLLRLRDIANTKYKAADREFNTLNTQVNNHIARTKNATQVQIDNIRKVLAEAKKANVSALTISCLKAQEGKANSLVTTSMNYCYTTANVSALKEIKGRFTTLANVAANTVTYCQNLNPLDSQLEPYDQCLADKVPDLNKQINLVDSEYEKLSNATLQYNVQCLTDSAGNILGQISHISYQINVCFFAPL